MFRSRTASLSVLALIAPMLATLATLAPPATAVETAQANVVSAVPASYTPDANNGTVFAIGQVGSTVVEGGNFTSVSPHGSSTAKAVTDIAAFTAGTGALVSSFAPTINGQVNSITPGPTSGTVYVAGSFTTVDGVNMRVALLNASTGAIVAGWKPVAINAAVNQVELGDGQLFVGGNFATAGGLTVNGLIALNPATGKLSGFATPGFTGHHNYTGAAGQANGAVGVKKFDISPDGTRMMVIGNFKNASDSTGTYARDQVAELSLGASAATVDPNWQTLAYTAACFDNAFDSYIRDVQYSPDGSYFVIVATGGSGTNSDGTNSSCDTAARFESSANGADVRPTWIDYTGQDTFWSVALTGSVVYVGGHERWVNNSKGHDNAGAGAVPRPGIAALDPVNGMPLTWNPGRNPRGAGAYALLATADGLYVGSDTDYIGNFKYLHKKLAFFPLAGGKTLPASTTPKLPSTVYTAGAFTGNLDRLSERHFDGSTAGTESALTTGISWGSVRGAFTVNGEVIYGKSDGKLYERSFDGTTFGAEVALDPYDDPTWDTVKTGSGTGTYQGAPPSLFGSELSSVTSMFFTNGRLYYTVANQNKMHWRWFEPESGVVGSDEFTTTDSTNWSNVAGAFLSGNTLYFANKSTGQLQSIPWSGTQASGTATVLATGQSDWASRGMFLLDDVGHPNQNPTASFTSNCTALACTFDGTGSSDPDGSIASYAWDFGDGGTSTSATPSHTFAAPGTRSVTLTVTDNQGATGTVTKSVAVSAAGQAIAFGGTAQVDGSGLTQSVTAPSGARAGDALLLFESFASTTVTSSTPSGWTQVGVSTNTSNLTTSVYEKVATAGDLGSPVSVSFSASVKASLTIADYANADLPVQGALSATKKSTATHTAPAISGLAAGSWVVSYLTDKSTTTSTWTGPSGATRRGAIFGTSSAAISALLADSGTAVNGGSYPAQTATTNATSGSAAQWTVPLAPQG